ncbi:type II toxin-antitoxin system RelB/DinJ family antitoxin [Companilactobacillus farciminis]|uniref:type II toxin-antitoxin system RelB/DinJ family antitoxin n=1 Tax=Companilactobacillus farciminis TaxID=1612 RepID=UPI001915D4E8|nr:type II toxin-antitoxin system RelB/DinJ family antitoxin [Companilactobacillus farciminis]WCG35990.1 type II toxin-antitoxin system RelB/DinJ family antitoxin [Companilactobacillus farciminis]
MQIKDNTKKKIQINIDRDLANQTQSILEELGLNQTTAINLFYKKIVADGGLPFNVQLTTDQKANLDLQNAIKGLPIDDLTDKKKLKEWFDDESQDY